MLQSIRDRAQGWIAWVIVFLISIPFALWGISEYIGVGGEPVVATVGDAEITERSFEQQYRDFRQRLRQQFGENFNPEMLDEKMLRAQVLDGMIEEEVVLQAAEDNGMRAGTVLVQDAIRNIGAFQINGEFNQQAYERALFAQGMRPLEFEEEVRKSLVRAQLTGAIRDSALAPQAELEEMARLREQQRTFAYLILPPADYMEQAELETGAAKSYYDAHHDEFMAPEQVQLEYLELDIDRIAENLEAGEEIVRGFYQEHKQDYTTPEQRSASHILITVPEDAEEAKEQEILEQAQAARQRILDGEDFAAVAKAVSEDPGSADLGGDLGVIDKGVMVAPFEEAVYAMEKGAISEPVRSRFGFHIIRLDDLQPEQVRSFEEAREDVAKAYLKIEAERLFYDYADRLANRAYEDPGSLLPAADALEMEVQTSPWISRINPPESFSSQKLLNAAFSEDVLLERNNSELIELGDEHVIVVRVIEHQPAEVKDFAEVEETITRNLRREQAQEMARAAGEALLERIRAREITLEAAAEEIGNPLQRQEAAKRVGAPVPREVLNAAFRMPRPEGETVRYASARTAAGGYAIIGLEGVTDGSLQEMDDAQRQQLRRSITDSRGQVQYNALTELLKAKADIAIKKKDLTPERL